MKTAISIPDSLFNAADRLAKRMGVSRSELYQRAVESYLKKHQRKAVTEALNEVYERDAEGSRLDSTLELMQYSSLPEEEW
jgi:metal-responsive CopG/Arc/MetJ family transcriptional regulator